MWQIKGQIGKAERKEGKNLVFIFFDFINLKVWNEI